MTQEQVGGLGRPILGETGSKVLAFDRLLLAVKVPNDWGGPLGQAAEIALSFLEEGKEELADSLLLTVCYWNEKLTAQESSDPEKALRELRKDFGISP